MPIRAVIFDFGGVFVRTEDWNEHRKWENHLGLTGSGLLKTVFGSEMAACAVLGQASSADVWQYVGTTLGLNAEQVRQLERDFWANDLFNEELAVFFRNLRPRYKTAILSNAWPDAREVFTQMYGGVSLADEFIISAEEGLAKPDAHIFQLVAQRLGVQPKEAIFVDDWAPNVQGALAVGMRAVQFKTNAQVIAEIQKYLDKD